MPPPSLIRRREAVNHLKAVTFRAGTVPGEDCERKGVSCPYSSETFEAIAAFVHRPTRESTFSRLNDEIWIADTRILQAMAKEGIALPEMGASR
jgi:hypothetical protein